MKDWIVKEANKSTAHPFCLHLRVKNLSRDGKMESYSLNRNVCDPRYDWNECKWGEGAKDVFWAINGSDVLRENPPQAFLDETES